MTLLGPLLMASLILSRYWIEMIPPEPQQIAVVDETGVFFNSIESSEVCLYKLVNTNLESTKKNFFKSDYDLILYIPSNILSGQTAQIFFKKQPGIEIISYTRTQVGKRLQEVKLIASGIEREKLYQTKTSIKILSTKMHDNGTEEEGNTSVKLMVGFLGGSMIYLFVFLFGSQVMRGVIEEKANRVIELIVTSVKPVELLMGKITGIALVGLTQYLAWVLLTFGISTFSINYLMQEYHSSDKVEEVYKRNLPKNDVEISQWEDSATLSAIGSINFYLLLPMFAFYFLGGFLLYGAMFAAIGAAVDNEADTQQFMLPISLPLILAFVAAQAVVSNPEGALAHWLSLIPFTSPIIMMVRIPFGVPIWEVALSAALLIFGFWMINFLAAKIYRTGILMYGKKPSFGEMLKWIKYKA